MKMSVCVSLVFIEFMAWNKKHTRIHIAVMEISSLYRSLEIIVWSERFVSFLSLSLSPKFVYIYAIFSW